MLQDSDLDSCEEILIDYEKDEMYTGLDLFLMGRKTWGGLSICYEDYTKEFLEEFVDGLRKARGEKFSTRLPLIAELSAVFNDFC